MSVALMLAKRYAKIGSTQHLIHWIGLLSFLNIAISSMALIVVLSGLNGLEGLLKKLYHVFEADFTISLTQGKYFEPDTSWCQTLKKQPNVNKIVEVLEDTVLLQYQDKQMPVRLKGVSENFLMENPLHQYIEAGQLALYNAQKQPLALIGRGIQCQLSIPLQPCFYPLQCIFPTLSTKGQGFQPPVVRSIQIFPGGVFEVEQHIDETYMIVPIALAAKLMVLQTECTALDIYITPGANIQKVQKNLQACLPSTFKVVHRDEQHVAFFHASRIERLFIFLACAVIVLMASLNILFTLSMLAMDKQQDMAILSALGATVRDIQKIFYIEGAFLALGGGLLGSCLALGIIGLQQRFGWLALFPGSATPFPLVVQATDVLVVWWSVILCMGMVVYFPARLAAKRQRPQHRLS